MFKKKDSLFWTAVVVLVVLVLVILWKTGIIEHLTGNAPTELPLPKYLKHSESTGPVANPDRLDPRDIPTGYDTNDTDYLLSQEVMQKLESEPHKSADVYAQEEKERQLKEQNDLLKKQNEELLKRLSKQGSR